MPKIHNVLGKTDIKGKWGKFTFNITECSCGRCREMCSRVCVPTPTEAQNIIKAGYGHKLQWYNHRDVDGDWAFLAPAENVHQNDKAYTVCTFFESDGKCFLHDKDLKPLEAKIVSCKKQKDEDLIRVLTVDQWNTKLGRSIIKEWKDKYRQDMEG